MKIFIATKESAEIASSFGSGKEVKWSNTDPNMSGILCNQHTVYLLVGPPVLTCNHTARMTLFTKECKSHWVNSSPYTNMPSLYMWVKTDLMTWKCLSYYKHTGTSLDLTLIELHSHRLHLTPLFYSLDKNIWHFADNWVTNNSLRNLPLKQRPLPITTVLSCFHDASASPEVYGNPHPYLETRAPRMMTSIHNDRKVGRIRTNEHTCGCKYLCRILSCSHGNTQYLFLLG